MNNKTVCTMDNSFRGHHQVYLDALRSIELVRDISKEFPVAGSIKRIGSYIRDRKRIIDFALRERQQHETLHLLYLDNLYTVGAFLPIPRNGKIIGTLHHYPVGKSKERLLKRFSNKLQLIIVHSEYIGKQLEAIGIRHYAVIDYPSFHATADSLFDRQKRREELSISADKIVLSAVGGTRFDKGLDILLESFKHLDESSKRSILLNIAGKEETYKYDYINKKIQEYGIEARLNLRLLSDEEFEENIQISDALVLPYRKVFTGNSGPMTEGISRGIPVIGTDDGNIGYLIRYHRLGYTFEPESSESLALSIQQFLEEGWSASEESEYYKESLSLRRFRDQHLNIYQALK